MTNSLTGTPIQRGQAIAILRNYGYTVIEPSRFPDGVHITIPGKVIGKKNAKKIATRGKKAGLFAKKEWVDFHKKAMNCFEAFHLLHPNFEKIGAEHEVHVRFLYYPPNRVRPDLSAIMETVGDLIQETKYRTNREGLRVVSSKGGEIIQDDRQILCWDGSRIMSPDKDNPRTEIFVRVYSPAEGEMTMKPTRKRKK